MRDWSIPNFQKEKISLSVLLVQHQVTLNYGAFHMCAHSLSEFIPLDSAVLHHGGPKEQNF